MTRSIEAQIDDSGQLHPLKAGVVLPKGKVTLVWEDAPDQSCWHMAQAVFAKDWSTPEEDEAWAPFQQDK